MMIINVGGELYHTTRATLCQSPFFVAMLRSIDNSVGTEEDADGNLFVDRNGAAFKDILEFLRTGCPIVPSVHKSTLQVEADYYGITNFETIDEVPHKKDVAMPPDTHRRELLRASKAERCNGRMRFMFSDSEEAELPDNIRTATSTTKGGTRYIYLSQLVGLGFRRVSKRMSQPGSKDEEEENDEDLPLFERTIRTAWVDLEKLDVVDGVWDNVDVVGDGRVAKVSAFEPCH